MAKSVREVKRGRRVIFELSDDETGASASVMPSFGFNMFDLRLPVGGRVRPVLASDPDWAENPRDPGRNGIPVLFPFPNRIGGGKFTFEGKTYQLPANNGPNAIHGFAIQADWDVVERGTDDSGAFIVGGYQVSRQSPEMLKHWPTDAVLHMKYTLSGRRLTLEVSVDNPTAEDLPWGFGIHPYFRLPFEKGGDQSKTEVIAPASRYWTLKDFLPTGERREVDERLDFRKGQPIKGLKLDDVLAGLSFEKGRCVCRLVDRNIAGELRLSFDDGFRELVVYTPPGEGDVISLEPYTQTTDAVNLQAKGIDAGLRILKHDERATLSIAIESPG